MYTIKREGDLGVRIVTPEQIPYDIYIPTLSVGAYLELIKLVELANETVERKEQMSIK